jgi:hypothetical protein
VPEASVERKEMKRFVVFVLLAVLTAACQNVGPTPPATGAAPTEYPTILTLPTLTPVPLTDPALIAFKQQLKDAFDSKDGDKLRDTVSFSKWVASIYREGGTMPIDPQRGLRLTLQFINENDLIVDAERNTYEPNWSVNTGDTSEFVLVYPKDGSAPYYAHLMINHEPGGWRYTGIITRIPYYDAPTIAQVRADPQKYNGKEYMYVGTYEGKDNPPAAAGAAPNDKAFIVNTFAGPIWVTMSNANYVFPLDPQADSKKGQLVRLFGTIKLQNGAPYIESDSVTFIAPTDYAHTQGVIEAVDEATRTVSLKPADDGAAKLYLSINSFVSLPDGTRGKFSDLKTGQTIDAIGVPQKDGSLRVEELFISK